MLSMFVKLQAVWLKARARVEDENGAVATEYVVLLVLIALGIIVGAAVLAGAINSNFTCASNSITPLSKSAAC